MAETWPAARGDAGVRHRRLDAFSGVFVPSVLTIVGAVLFLRLPQIVGQAGLLAALGIIVAAHAASVTTALSVASLATDKRVRAGGSYAIVARSLGLPVGGTVGLALVVGLCASVALFVVGFAESFLTALRLGLDPATGRPDADAVRLVGSAALALVTVATFLRGAFVARLHHLVMVAIVAALVAVALGPAPPSMTETAAAPAADGGSFALLFGLLFPAVTGFEAGLARSGELRDPARALPRGILAAVGVGLLTYLGAAALFALALPADQLASNPRVLFDGAASAALVAAGAWGASLAAAWGTATGAPRVLQALAADRVAPRLLAKRFGANARPRSAVAATALLAEVGVLLGGFEALAVVVTVTFIASYVVLNLACLIESWTSPDFRPTFRIPRVVSGIGVVVPAALVVFVHLEAALGALAVMAVVFLWLGRRQLVLEGGDTWVALWASLARKAIDRLSRRRGRGRVWRPNVLLFTTDRTPARARELARALVAHNGVMTELVVGPPEEPEVSSGGPEAAPEREAPALPEGVFRRRLVTPEPWDAIRQVCRFHGIGDFVPDTVVFDWEVMRASPERADALLPELDALGKHTIVYRAGRGAGHGSELDVWWRGPGGNLALSAALVRFLTLAGEWVQASPRFLATVADAAQRRTVERRIAAWLTDNHIRAAVHVLEAPAAPDTYEALVARVSARAALTIVGLEAGAEAMSDVVTRLAALSHPVLLVRSAPGSSDPFPYLRLDAEEDGAPTPGARRDLPATLELVDDPALSGHLVAYHDALSQALTAWQAEGPEPLVRPVSAAVDEVARLAERALAQIERATAIHPPERRTRALRRVERGLLRALEAALGALSTALGGARRDVLRAALDVLSERLLAVEEGVSEILLVSPTRGGGGHAAATAGLGAPRRRRRRDAAGEGRYVRWPLRWHVAAIHATAGRAAVLRALVGLREGRAQLLGTVEGLVTWVVATVGRAVALGAGDGAGAGWAPDGALAEARAALAERVAVCRASIAATLEAPRRDGAMFARDAAQRISHALSEPTRTRRVKRAGRAAGPLDVPALLEEVEPSLGAQHRRCASMALELGLRGMQREVEAAAEQIRADLGHAIARDVLAPLDAFTRELQTLGEASSPVARGEGREAAFDERALLQHMQEAIERSCEALPEQVEVVSDAGPRGPAAGGGRRVDPPVETVALRRLVTFVLNDDLLDPLRGALGAITEAVDRASNAVREVARLLRFTERASPDEAGDERAELVAAGGDRIAGERARVVRACAAAEAVIEGRVARVVQRTEVANLGRAARELERFVRAHERQSLGARVRRRARRVGERVRRGMVDLAYRWSRGVLLARRMKATPDEPASAVERVIALVRAATPPPAVEAALPIFYRQVFIGRAAADPAYGGPAAEELLAAQRAVESHRLGYAGALWVTGPTGSGVGALIDQLVRAQLGRDRAFVVQPPRLGSIDPERFDAAVCAALGSAGDVDAALGALPARSAVVVDGLARWWERSPLGLAVAERLAGLVERHGARVLFVVGVNVHVMRVLRQLDAGVDQVVATVHCRPLDAVGLRDAVMRRHDATGLGLRLRGAKGRAPSEWTIARLFTGLFEYSGGYLGPALHGWIAHLTEVTDDAVVVRRPRRLALDALDALERDGVALLVALVLHERIDADRLARVTGLQAERLDAALAGLRRTGLVTPERAGEGVALNRFVQHHIERWLVSKGLL